MSGGAARGWRVLVVDDSVVVRRLVARALEADPRIEAVHLAANGRIALEQVAAHPPDVVVCDVEMPELDGVQTVRAIRSMDRELPILMFSSLTARGADVTLEALAAGATDHLLKPKVADREEAERVIRDVLVDRVDLLCARRSMRRRAEQHASRERQREAIPSRPRPTGGERPAVVAIGVSTGGPAALSEVLGGLPASFPVPILVVQHMPADFTAALARRLDGQLPLRVLESEPGIEPLPGDVVIARGGQHLVVEGTPSSWHVGRTSLPPVHESRPSVDVLFRSLPPVFGGAVLAVVLTGMGCDGVAGASEIMAAGGHVLAQDEATSVVWGMPGRAVEAGVVDEVLPLDRVAAAITARVGSRRRVAAP